MAVVDALDKIVETSLVRQAMNVVMDQYSEIAPEDFHFIFETGITAELLYEDVNSIIEILRAVVETEIYTILDGEEVSLVGLADEISSILDSVLHLNILSIDMANVLENVLAMVGLEVAYEDLATIDYDLDYAVIYGVLDRIETMLTVNSNIETINELLDVIEGIEVLDDVLYDRTLVSNDNLHEILYVVEEIINMQLVEVLFNPAYDTFVAPMFEQLQDTFKPLTDLSDYDAKLLVEDLTNILQSLHGLVDFNILGIVLDDATITWDVTTPVEEVIKTIFSINYLQVKEQAIIDIIDSFNLGIVLTTDDLDFAADGSVIAKIYCELAAIMNYCMEVDTVSEIFSINFGSEYIDDQFAQYVVNVLSHLDELSFFEALIEFGFEKLEEIVPEDFAFLAEMGEAGVAGIVEDYNTLIDILQILVNVHVPATVFQGYNMSYLIEYEVHQIIDLVFGMNYIGMTLNLIN